MDNIAQIKDHFDDPNRIQHDINNYGVEKTPDKTNFDPYEKPREDFIFSLIQENHQHGRAVLDVGCGIGNLVRKLRGNLIEADGIDVSDQMIKTAQQLHAKANIPENCVQCADILAYQCRKTYQLIVANGVIWYYQDKMPFLMQVNKLLDKAGICIIVHRNDLFNIYAMNEGTLHFMQTQLFQSRTQEDKDYLRTKLLHDFPNLSAPIDNNRGLPKPYDNPLAIHQLYQQAGFEVLAINATYIHPFPPKYMPKDAVIDYHQLQQQYGKQWQGLFLGSQFIVVARKT